MSKCPNNNETIADSPHYWELKDRTTIDNYEYERTFSETFICKYCGRIKKIITSNKDRKPTVKEYEYE